MEVQLKSHDIFQRHSEYLLMTGRMSDIEIIVYGDSMPIKAHKTHLSIAFSLMDISKLKAIRLSGISRQTVFNFLQFVYTGRMICQPQELLSIKSLMIMLGSWNVFQCSFGNLLNGLEEENNDIFVEYVDIFDYVEGNLDNNSNKSKGDFKESRNIEKETNGNDEIKLERMFTEANNASSNDEKGLQILSNNSKDSKENFVEEYYDASESKESFKESRNIVGGIK